MDVELNVEDLEGYIWPNTGGDWKTMGDFGGLSTFCFLAAGAIIK
jgi:hypothetical protein